VNAGAGEVWAPQSALRHTQSASTLVIRRSGGKLLQFLRLRVNSTILCLLIACICAKADVIHLRNGKTIIADSAHETNGRIEYTIGDNTFAIPKSLVEKIDTEKAPPVSASRAAPAAEIPELREPVEAVSELSSTILRGGRLNLEALKAVEGEGRPDKSAAANFLAAQFEERQNNLPSAARYMQVALTYKPNDSILLEQYAAVLLRLNRKDEALTVAERAVRTNSSSADALAVLGYAYYQNERNKDAISTWKKSLALRPNPKVTQLLEHAQRESAAEADFHRQESSHFVLRYEGEEAPSNLRYEILDTLEAQYRTLQNDLGISPRNSISVSLYTNREFFDVTQAPAWTAALNDGKIRIPISGLTAMTPALNRVLRHELTHSFIAQITHGNVPTWLNEGIAQLEEPASTTRIGARLAAVYSSGNQVPLNQLGRSFLGYTTPEAMVAYAEALAAAECIRNKYGMPDLARILERLGEGEPIENALRNTIHNGYAQFETELAEYLKHEYGQ
jgi:tetratricopeptide (TPR) repeat protein